MIGWLQEKLDDFTALEIESSDHLRQKNLEEKACNFALISPLRLCSQHTDGEGSGKSVHILTSLHRSLRSRVISIPSVGLF